MIRDFRQTGLRRAQSRLVTELQAYAPTAAQHVAASAERVIPVYTQALQSTFTRDQDRYLETLVNEFGALENYAMAQSPKIEESIASLVEDQRLAADKALKGILSEEDFARISLAYNDALQAELERTMEQHFSEHMVVGERIIEKIQRIAETESGPLETDPQVITGMLVELLGMEMQLQGAPLAEAMVETGQAE